MRSNEGTTNPFLNRGNIQQVAGDKIPVGLLASFHLSRILELHAKRDIEGWANAIEGLSDFLHHKRDEEFRANYEKERMETDTAIRKINNERISDKEKQRKKSEEEYYFKRIEFRLLMALMQRKGMFPKDKRSYKQLV